MRIDAIKTRPVLARFFNRATLRTLSSSREESESARTALPQAPAIVEVIDYKYSFWAIFAFTLILYLRPSDFIPGMGTFPFAKIAAIAAPVIYILEQNSSNERFLSATVESMMILLICALGILHMPFAMVPMKSYEMLTDQFLKVVIMFNLMIQVVNRKERLKTLFTLVTTCGGIFGVMAIRSFLAGDLKNGRIGGAFGGMFENPNDLAVALNMLWPIAVVLAMSAPKLWRIYYLLVSLVMIGGVYATQSRGGFLEMVAVIGVLIWKFGRGRRVKVLLAVAIAGILVAPALPESYQNRIASIFDNEKDKEGSAQERRHLMGQARDLAIENPIFGVGMNNFTRYSFKGMVAHNGYLEIAAELGALGLLAYILLILSPIYKMNRIERSIPNETHASLRDVRYLSIGVQASLIAYLLGSLVGSIQYVWYVYYAAFYAISLSKICKMETVVAGPYIPPPPKIETGVLRESVRQANREKGLKPGILWASRKGVAKIKLGNRKQQKLLTAKQER
jgi:probable O-glycosylation ligase (exosortase A-associated)